MNGTEQHADDEFCFFCATDDVLLAGFGAADRGEAYEGPTVHWQVPETFCPQMPVGGDAA